MVAALTPIQSIIDEARNGQMFILVDNEDRENEGDLITPADTVTPEAINFMAKYGRGLICLAMASTEIDRLNLPLMTADNSCKLGTNFTVSIDAKKSVTTGISAADRAHTIKLATNQNSTFNDFSVPGHIFPLRAHEHGVLERAGHTEASVAVSQLAGLNGASVICEIMNDDGTMARLPDLITFAKQHNLKIGSISDLIQHIQLQKQAA